MKEEAQIKTYVTFQLEQEHFAIPVAQVSEILELLTVTPVPESACYMRGILNLRGQMLPVVDSRLKFGLEKKADTKNSRIVVLSLEREGELFSIGLVVDAVSNVAEFSEESIQQPSEATDFKKADYVTGIINDGKQLIMLLDVDKIMRKEDASLLER